MLFKNVAGAEPVVSSATQLSTLLSARLLLELPRLTERILSPLYVVLSPESTTPVAYTTEGCMGEAR